LHLGRTSFGDLHPVVQHGDMVGEPHDDLHIVLDEEDGQPQLAREKL
jgi:hypothetical protein